MMSMPQDPLALLADLERWEGRVPWLYKDTRNNLTVGVGCIVENVSVAQTMPFLDFATAAQIRATPEQIAREFARVTALPAGLIAIQYRNAGLPDYPPVELAFAGINQVGEERIDWSCKELVRLCPGFLTFPEPAQACLLDLAWNLGIGELSVFHLLLAAVNKGDWVTASEQCHVATSSYARNLWRAREFKSLVPGPVV